MNNNQYMQMQGGMPPLITLTSRKQQVDIFRLPATVGRNGEEVDIFLFDESISRIHCRFDMYQGSVTVTDLYSTMGTKVEKTMLNPGQQYMIESGCKIKIGKCKFKVMINQQAVFAYHQQMAYAQPAQPQQQARPQQQPGAQQRFSFDETSENAQDSAPAQQARAAVNAAERPQNNSHDANGRSKGASNVASTTADGYDYDSEVTEPLVKKPEVMPDYDYDSEKTEVIAFSEMEERLKFPMRRLVDTEDEKLVCLVDKSPYILGRRPDGTDAAIEAKGVSRQHLKIERTDEGFFVTDLASTNGVKLNGEKIEPETPVPLQEGDLIGIGEKELRFDQ